MANKTYAVHTDTQNIKRIDEWAKELRRSRNSIINEAIEMVLEHYDAARLKTITPNGKKATRKATR
jgi:predicted transcriptional regulator